MKMKKKSLFYSAALSLSFASASAFAVSFSDLDVDKDGRISNSEASANPDFLFSQLDKNADGHLSQSELTSVGAPSAGGIVSGSDFNTLDKNHDGYLTQDEASSDQVLSSRFSELDKDRDGHISRVENDAAMGGGPTGGRIGEERVMPDASTTMNLEPPSDVQGRGEAYSDVESAYGNPDVRGID